MSPLVATNKAFGFLKVSKVQEVVKGSITTYNGVFMMRHLIKIASKACKKKLCANMRSCTDC